MNTWVGPFEGTGAYPTINRQLTAALERQGWPVLRNVHNVGLDITPIAIAHEYPPKPINVSHALNVCLAVWEFTGKHGVPKTFIETFRHYDLICAPCQWVADQFNAVTQTPVAVIQWGFDPAEMTPIGERVDWSDPFPGEAWVKDAEKVLLWVGGTDRRHGLDVAINVMDLLPDSYHLVIKQSVHYPQDNCQHPRAHVLYHDFPSLAPLYRAADLLLHSARGVGFSLIALDALACGLPVAATDLPPLHAYGGDRIIYGRGIWKPMGIHHVHRDCLPEWLEPDVDALADAVAEALKLPKRAAPNQELIDQWSWDAAARILREAVGELEVAPVFDPE
jgi:glycosyltransferase involved in cell wall biosynthesis